ncbi:MAG TPA: peptidoglycan editing factor PgeF [Humisphaera sp.]
MPSMERVAGPGKPTFYRSPTLRRAGIPHGFSTRVGGVSRGRFASLNLGNPNGAAEQDAADNIAENYVRLHAAVGAAGRARAYVHQVHGCGVELARPGEPFDVNRKADAVATDDPAAVAAVRVADCVPVLLATADGRAVAAVHAGWRGVVAGVVLRGAEAVRGLAGGGLVGDGAAPLLAAVGPAISFDAFEVGPEVAAEFERAFGGDAADLLKPSRNDGKAMVDLRGAIVIQLRSLGLDAGAIDVSDRCTYRDEAEFFSHRRDDGVTGRMAALVGPVG